MNTYKPLTDKDITRMMNMPAVCDQACIDVSRVLWEKMPDASILTRLCFIYKWGYLQGKRGVENWHGQSIKKRSKTV